jgi:O-antigen biosynthesis protein
VGTPRVSVFTPSNRTRFLDECFATMVAQTFQDWEWIVVLNQGMRWRPESDDPRVRIMVDDTVTGVGAAKHRACAEAVGEILLELDHDDLLASTCLDEVVAAFDANPDVGFVYSDTGRIREDGSRDEGRFSEAHGWTYRDEIVDGRRVLVSDAMKPTPHNVSYIWYAPNHVRAFRRELYEKVGGYDETLTVADDHDLMCKLYQVTEFHHIPRCLYLQRMHGNNTQAEPETNARIQEMTVQLYDRHVQLNALAWAKRRGLLALDMGAAHNKPEGYLGVDQYDQSGVDMVCDVSKGVDLPDGRGAFQDPTHVAFYNENSFWYVTNRDYARFVPQITCRFQSSRLVTYFPGEWHRTHNICYVSANLIAIKDDTRNGGFLAI